MITGLSDSKFHDEAAAREHLEALRWPDGPFCPHCGQTETVKRLGGKAGEKGQLNCRDCRKKFTVTVGTLFERSHVPLHKWLLAFHLMCASKKGISAHQLHRMLDVTYKTAWFMAHRIREAMRDGDLDPMGGPDDPVEADETFIGKDPDIPKGKASYKHKMKVLTLIDRNTKQARSFHVKDIKVSTLAPIIRSNVRRESVLMTDQAHHYKNLGKEFTRHGTVDHSRDEYVRGDAYTNTAEGYFSIFKRGMKGIYQHCGSQHLHRYLAEFDFRYNNRTISDAERAEEAIKNIKGRRLTYRRTNEARIS